MSNAMAKAVKKARPKAAISKREQYRRFAKAARKAGLLITKKTYDLVFREQLSANAKAKGQ